jgi:hypothetical protein
VFVNCEALTYRKIVANGLLRLPNGDYEASRYSLQANAHLQDRVGIPSSKSTAKHSLFFLMDAQLAAHGGQLRIHQKKARRRRRRGVLNSYDNVSSQFRNTSCTPSRHTVDEHRMVE